MADRGDLTDEEWERLRPLLPVSNGRCGQWRDHRQVINGMLHRVRTRVQWRDLPERFGPWKTVYERHRRWSDTAMRRVAGGVSDKARRKFRLGRRPCRAALAALENPGAVKLSDRRGTPPRFRAAVC